ncbi:MAG: DUF805 domain-containing protein [Alphaproteobacteria bacterium]|nr:DUF805 domain-containing protein [Alphaproteobacteria bacterium]
MNFGEAIASCFNQYATFKGRAPRSEYWYWALFMVLLGIVAGVTDVMVFGVTDIRENGPAETVLNLLTILPSIAVSVRRLHDIDRSGWWMLTIILPIIWALRKGDEGINRFGPPPESMTRRRVL